MPVARLNGVRIHYLRSGHGESVVMIHGLAANVAFWYLKLVPRLVDRFEVTVYDLRGHGMSEMTPSGYDPRSLSLDLSALLDHCGIERAHVVGHSFGGSIAVEYALAHPERVRTLTLADAVLYAVQPFDDARDREYWSAWRKQLADLGIDVPADLPKIAYGLLEELADPRWQAARQRNRSDAFFVPFGLWNGARRGAALWLQLLRTTSAWREFCQPSGLDLESVRRLACPVLLMYGERSRWIRTLDILGDVLPHAHRVVVPAAGHFHPLIRPGFFTRHLRQFVLAAEAR